MSGYANPSANSNVTLFREFPGQTRKQCSQWWLKPVTILVSMLLLTSMLSSMFSGLAGTTGAGGSLLSDPSGSSGVPDSLKALLTIGAATFIGGCTDKAADVQEDINKKTAEKVGVKDSDPYGLDIYDKIYYKVETPEAGAPLPETVVEDGIEKQVLNAEKFDPDNISQYIDILGPGVISLAKLHAFNEHYNWGNCPPFEKTGMIMTNNDTPQWAVIVQGPEDAKVIFNEAALNYDKEKQYGGGGRKFADVQTKEDLGKKQLHKFESKFESGNVLKYYDEFPGCEGIYYKEAGPADLVNFISYYTPDREFGVSMKRLSADEVEE